MFRKLFQKIKRITALTLSALLAFGPVGDAIPMSAQVTSYAAESFDWDAYWANYPAADATVTGTYTRGTTSDGVEVTVYSDGTAIMKPMGAGTLRVGYGTYPSWSYDRTVTDIVRLKVEPGVVAKDLATAFYHMTSLTHLDLSEMDTSQNIDCCFMCSNNSALTYINLENFNTAMVTDMQYMFNACKNMTSLDLSEFSTSNVTNTKCMFNACSKLADLKLSGFSTENVTNMEAMFSSCNALTSLNLTSFNTSKATNMAHMFKNCQSLTSVDVSGFDTSKVTTMHHMFYNCTELASLDTSQFNTANVTDMRMMFYNCRKLATLDVSGFDTSKVTDMTGLFHNMYAVTSLDVSGFNTSKVTSMPEVFKDCHALTSVDVSGFDTSKVTSMERMFQHCYKLQGMDVSGFDTSHVTDMTEMFEGDNFGTLDLSNFNTSGTTTQTEMFNEMDYLQSVSLGQNFSFKDSVLPTPTGGAYTGKWIRDDSAYGPYTPAELATAYDANPSALAGNWVTQIKPSYIVTFSAGDTGAAGAMPTIRMSAEEDDTVPESLFQKFGYVQTGWEDPDNTDGEGQPLRYMFDENGYAVIPANTYHPEYPVTLVPVFEPRNTTAVMENGEFYITLHEGESAKLSDLPAGTYYQIFEETSDGWKLIEQTNTAGTITAVKDQEAYFLNDKQENGDLQVQFQGRKLLDGSPAPAGAFTFELLDAGGTVIQTKENGPYGIITFDPITFKKYVITTNYMIREVDAGDSSYIYDPHTEQIGVQITQTGNKFTLKETYDEDGIVFRNHSKDSELRITKTGINVNESNKDDTFTFKITLQNENGTLVDGGEYYWYYTDENGIVQLGRKLSVSAGNLAGKVGHAVSDFVSDIFGQAEQEETQEGESLNDTALETETGSETVLNISENNTETGLLKHFNIAEPFADSKNNSRGITTSALKVLDFMLPETITAYAAELSDDTNWDDWPSTTGITRTGTAGNVTWTLYTDGTLVFKSTTSGTSDSNSVGNYVMTFQNYSSAPWNTYKSQVKRIKFEKNGNVMVKFATKTEGGTNQLFFNYTNLEAVDLSGLKLYAITENNKTYYAKLPNLFQNCTKLTDVRVGGMRMDGVGTMAGWFRNCTALKEIDFSSITGNATNIQSTASMFHTCTALERVTLGIGMFGNGGALTDMNRMFMNCSNLQSVDFNLSTTNKTKNVTNMRGMFSQCRALTSIDLTNFNTSSAQTMYQMFNNCNVLDENGVDLSGFDTSNVVDMYAMFLGTAFTELDLSHFNTSKVGTAAGPDPASSGALGTMNETFKKMPNLKTLDISNFDTSNVPSMNVMFGDDATYRSPIETIKLGPNFKFNGNGIVETANQAKLPKASSEYPYTGMWIRSDKAYGPLTDTELRDTWNPQEMNGTWVWERASQFIVHFDANGGMGTMNDFYSNLNEVSVLPANTFSKKGYIFTGWCTTPDGGGVRYEDRNKGIIEQPAEGEEAITLYAIWTKNTNVATPKMGELYITCKAGQTIVIPDLPGGTTYTVEEINIPDGWTLKEKSNEGGMLSAGEPAEVEFTNEYAAAGVAQIIAHKRLIGDDIFPNQFFFTLYDGTGMPVAEGWNRSVDEADEAMTDTEETIPNPWKGTAPIRFEELVFEEPGDYTYTIQENDVGYGDIIFDEHVETVIVHVTHAGNGLLKTDVEYDEDGALFTNRKVTGSLTITKETVSDGIDTANAEFSFVPVFTNSSGSVLYDEYVWENNKGESGTVTSEGSILLKGGETVTISGLPHDAEYVLEETEKPGWTLAKSEGAYGRIDANEASPAEAVFTNVYTTNGTAKISGRKTVTGKDVLPDTYQFELLKDGQVIARTYADGSGQFAFDIDYEAKDHGNTYHYAVREVPGDDHMIYDSHTEEISVTVNDNGEGVMVPDIVYDADGAVFTNTVTKKLLITNEVRGNFGDRTKKFEYAFTVTNGDIEELPSGWEKTGEGTYVFTLSHGEETEVYLPIGARFEVTEDKDNYQAEVSVDGSALQKKNKASKEIEEDVRVDFVNTLDTNVPTGIDVPGPLWIFMVMILAGAAAICGANMQKKRKHTHN